MTDPKELADALISLDEDNCLETHERRTLESAIAFLRSLEDRGTVRREGDPHTEVVRLYVDVNGNDNGKRVFVQWVGND